MTPPGPPLPWLTGAQIVALRSGLRVFGVTGTNGKTTTTMMIDAIASAAGEPSARVTTLGAWVRGEAVADGQARGGFVTALQRAHAEGVGTFVVEMTSAALRTGFALRFPADIGVFTNLSRDHLDRHGTIEAYLDAKAELFRHLRPSGVAVLNAGDQASARLTGLLPPSVRALGYAARPVAPGCEGLPLALRATSVRASREGTHVRLARGPLADALGGALALSVLGEVHAENALAAAVAAHAAGFPPAVIARALTDFRAVPGRFEVVSSRPWVIVDYAHTPDALERTLRTARRMLDAEGAGGTLACVFGCGGDRDRGKRAEMGRVAATIADRVVVTSDNPRGEEPGAIAAEIERGAARAPAGCERLRELDRRRAIELAIGRARPADAVVVAGKGHEVTQAIAGAARPFSDVAVARAALAEPAPGRLRSGATRKPPP